MYSFLRSVKKRAIAFSPVDLSRPINSNLAGIGTAKDPVGRHLLGKIQINGNLWSALNVDEGTIPAGSHIKIVGRRDLVLYVQSAQYA